MLSDHGFAASDPRAAALESTPPMSLSTGLSIEELLEHTGWLRALARRLANDAATAEDVVQDTVLTALRSRPASGVTVRQWLARVVRNFARQSARTSRISEDGRRRVTIGPSLATT